MADKYKNVVPHGKKSRRQCSNDEGGIIDTCMLRLKQYRIDDYELIIAHFVMGVSLRCLAKINECSDGKIRKKMQMAMGFIAGCIYYR
ncbi:TPA: phage antitermination protein [Escherichia coli]|nr:phage antitermination protein [Escherichia coli]